MMESSPCRCIVHFSSIYGGISLPCLSIFCYGVKELNCLPCTFLIKLSCTHYLDVLFIIQGYPLMKIRRDLSHIQTMMRDSMEEVLVSFSYYNKRFTRFFRKILDCAHESIDTCGREEFVKEFILHILLCKD